jgi:hypothetical protein
MAHEVFGRIFSRLHTFDNLLDSYKELAELPNNAAL